MTMSAASFKERVAKTLGFPADDRVFAIAWEYIEGSADEQAWIEADKDRKQKIVRAAAETCKRFLVAREDSNAAEVALDTVTDERWGRPRTRMHRSAVDRPTPDWVFYAELSEAENERARGLAVYYAALASEEAYVVKFREGILGDEMLRPDAAKEWVTSVAAQCVSPDAYATLRQMQSPPGHPEIEITDMENGAERFDLVAKLRDRGTGETLTSRLSLPDGLAIHNVTLGEEQIEVYEGMTLDCLRLYGERLAKQYGWDREQAMWFILTDIPPSVHPLDSTTRFTLLGGPGHPWTAKRQEVTITVDPWVSEATLLETYRRLRHDLRGKQGRTSLKTLTLFRFITERDGLTPQLKVETRSEAVPWTARMKKWNDLHEEAHSDWEYKDRANFRAAYYDVAETVIGPAAAPEALMNRLNAIAREQQRRRADNHADNQEER